MPSEYTVFRASLLRRFSSIEGDLSSHHYRDLKKSFSIAYLRSFRSDTEDEPFDVALTKVALRVARFDGQEVAAKVVQRFSKDALGPANVVLEGEEVRQSHLTHYCDKFLASSPIVFDGFERKKRRCYDEVLARRSISTPLDKKGMLSLLQLVDDTFEHDPVRDFAALTKFIWDFATRTWPLFDASVLHIPMKYFKFDNEISMSDMKTHVALMDGYGLERLLSRLIVLRAISSNWPQVTRPRR
ncbi:hypothetical protein DFP92_1111 [Yoonia sediminilitoris]|uniref:Uncharacterized protein n=1 Tax=Yoonia sediminilitoris TaxID=1286148 RepID=A0A2T6KAX4_9RHOB|nr:hypothetical protein C8N45_1112 [Yoonia sediminilitoris]RCW92852.1 hypothetical protein DFP92_1111 [Yoonia sediminilitoris]